MTPFLLDTIQGIPRWFDNFQLRVRLTVVFVTASCSYGLIRITLALIYRNLNLFYM